jgi:hypothetical protein
MTARGKRARIGVGEELQISHYSLEPEFGDMQRTKLAEKIQAEVDWTGKPPEIEVLERKISHYRNHAIDYTEDKPWSLATLDKHPIPPEAIPAVLACWKRRVQAGAVLTMREAKWVSRLYALMAEEIRQNSIWRHGIKWLELETRCNDVTGKESSPNQSWGNEKKASEFSLQVGKGDYGVIECPKCETSMGIGPTSRKAICVGCNAQFDIVRISVGAEESGVVRKETSVVKNIPLIFESTGNLLRYAKGYAHLEFLYDLIGRPFDSTSMDMLLMGLGPRIPDLDEEASFLPYLALGIEDIKDFKDKIRRLANERTHNQEG